LNYFVFHEQKFKEIYYNVMYSTLRHMKREDVIKNIIRNRTLCTLKPGVLKVAAYANFYPVCYRRNGKWKGLDVDLLTMFCQVADLKLELVEVDKYDKIWFAPPDGKADTAIGGIAKTDKRTKFKTAWSIPYFYVQRTLVYNKNDPVDSFPQDIDGDVRATVGSTGYLDAAKKLKAAKMLKYLKPGKKDAQDIKDLLSGKIKGLVRGSFVGRALVKKYGRLGMLEPWEIDSTLVPSDGECFAFPCHVHSGLAEMLSTFITLCVMNGTLRKLVKKYKLE